jgi:hypothetical protein
MNKKEYLASFLIVPLAAMEIGELKAAESIETPKERAAVAARDQSVGSNPHTHFDINDPYRGTPGNIASLGGGRARERFALHLRPEGGGIRAIGYPHGGDPTSKPQAMYGFYGNIEAVISQLDLPTVQAEAVKRIALQGLEQQIGGHGFPLLLQRAELARLGMTFRPAHC